MRVKLHYKSYGNGEPLLIMHGFLGSLDNWHTLAGKFGLHHHVLAIDLRNHGKSPQTTNHSISLMVDDLLGLIDDLQLGQVTLLGHSMGGKVAMQFALDYPDRVSKLIVVDIAPRQYAKGHDDVFKAIFSVNIDRIQNRRDAELCMLPFLEDFGTRQFLLKNLERREEGGFGWKMNLDVLYHDYDEIIKGLAYKAPFPGHVLVIRGGNSRYIMPPDEVDFQLMFPKVKIETIAEAGHWVHAEKPDEFYSLVNSFLAAHN